MANGQSPLVVEGYVEAYNRNLQSMERYIFRDSPNEHSQIARVESTDRLTNERQAIQGLSFPRLNRDQEAAPQVAPVKGYKSTIYVKSYRSQVSIEETFMRTAVYKEPLDNARDMMRSTVSLKDKTAIDLGFNNGFTNSLSTNITEFDGTARAPFSTGHYYEDGSGTWSNYYNVGVPPNPETVYLIINQYLRRLKDFANTNFVSYGPEFIIVTPTANPTYGMAADEICMSVDRPDTANRATNVLKGANIRLRHVALNWLTSTTKWFIIVPTGEQSYPLRLLNLEDYSVTPLAAVGPINPHAYVTTCRTQFGVGWDKHYRGMVAAGT